MFTVLWIMQLLKFCQPKQQLRTEKMSGIGLHRYFLKDTLKAYF